MQHVTRDGIPSQKALENTLIGSPQEGKVTNFDTMTDFSIEARTDSLALNLRLLRSIHLIAAQPQIGTAFALTSL